MSATANQNSTDLAFITSLFQDSGIPFDKKEEDWVGAESGIVKVTLSIQLPFPRNESNADEPTATMDWIFKGEEIVDINVYAQPGPPPEPVNPPEFSHMAFWAADLGMPKEPLLPIAASL